MSHDHLGLFDTPPDRRQVQFSLGVVGLLFAAFLLILPVRDLRLGPIDALVPMTDAVMLVGDLITATLIFAQASVFRSRALTVLGAGYVYTALLFIPHALTFPGAFSPNGLLGAGLNTSPLLSIVRRTVFPIAVMFYVQLKRAEAAEPPGTERPGPRVLAGVTAATVLAAVVTLLAMIGDVWLPPFFANGSALSFANAAGYESVEFALFIVATMMLFRSRASVLDMWLLVAFAGWLIQSVLIMTLHGRYTAGWYALYAVLLFSHLVVMLALIAESNRLYARLALATAARNREREAQLMSMDAMVAAVAHEVGQPLTAVSIHAKAGLNRLTRPRPDLDRAIVSLRAILDAGRRTSEVIKSMRATFAQQPVTATEFSLNDLLRATASLLDRELAGERISLQLALDDALPPILANRVQIQRVLINLVTNAIESLGATQGRARRIVIRTAPADDHDVLLEISDNGVGVAPEQMATIFEAFVTTKAAGTGLGLSLCRSIVEAHGGHLWASRGAPYGATFHLQLPRSGALTSAQRRAAEPTV